MKIGLLDVDSHRFPNLALMRIAGYHKSKGDTVEWWSPKERYHIVYKSKVFSDAYTKDKPDPSNCDVLIKGGTGYCISLDPSGKEVFDRSKNNILPDEIEHAFPDYAIYPKYQFCVSMTSRGCPRACAFCHVAAKEGRCSVKVADLSEFYEGQDLIQCCDPNLTACKDKRELFQQYIDSGAIVEFNQGLDVRLLNDADLADLSRMKLKSPHFAWDNPQDDLLQRFTDLAIARGGGFRSHGANGTVYCLTNFEDCSTTEHLERALRRIYALRDLGFSPYVMLYDKPHAAPELRLLQRWCNNRYIFYSVKDFKDYV